MCIKFYFQDDSSGKGTSYIAKLDTFPLDNVYIHDELLQGAGWISDCLPGRRSVKDFRPHLKVIINGCIVK